MLRPESILGDMRYPGVFTPMISRPALCSVTPIVPIGEAMLEPIRHANTKAEIVGLNSSIVESREILPAILCGTSGLDSWKATRTVATAPIKTEMMEIMPSEPTPCDTISRITSAQ